MVTTTNLVDGHHDGHPSHPRCGDGLLGLLHDAIVGRHHKHHDVRRVRASRSHLAEGGMARGIDEGEVGTGVGLNLPLQNEKTKNNKNKRK